METMVSVVLKYLCLVVQCSETGVYYNELADMSSDTFFADLWY
jgi:hypothetical protein